MVSQSGKELRVAIVHDWLIGGGAERVVEQLHKLYPDAPIYTSVCSPEWRKKLDGKVVTGYLQHWPFRPLRKFLGVLRIGWFGRIDFSGYDVVISSSGNGEAKDINVPKGVKHICYCHSPVHFYWRNYKQYLDNPGFGVFNFAARLGLRLLVGPLRKRDYKAAQKPDYFIANSSFIADQIKKYYGRDSTVINPPLDTARFSKKVSSSDNTGSKRSGFVTMGRHVPYKRTDLIVDACTKLNLALTVIGNGPEHQDLVRRAGPTVTFPDYVSDDQMQDYLSSAEGFIFAAQEDFGIAPLEGIASGTPVIAYADGGATDYVIPGKTGMFFEEQTVQSLCHALETFKANDYKNQEVADFAKRFSEESFRNQIADLVANS